jgi:predicted DNA-binding transcriptional regulator AlpA
MNTPKAYTIPEWCEANRVSRGSFYNLKKAGQAPRTYNVGTRVLISAEADAEWRKDREAAANRDEVAA